MRTEAILFDYGLTLVSFEYPTQALLGVMEKVRPWLGTGPPTAEWLLFHVLQPLESDLDGFSSEIEVDYQEFYRRAWKRAGLDLDEELLYQILDLEQRCWDDAVKVVPRALDVLDSLRARGVMTAICSNAPFPPEMMRRQVDRTGIGERMDAVVFSSAVGRRKPAPEPYLAALSELDLTADKVLFVGDRVREDYEGPLAVGMRAVICTAFATSTPPPGIPTISSLAELASVQ
jgi:HAD superfamily hydrolase (TIGR01509 family)